MSPTVRSLPLALPPIKPYRCLPWEHWFGVDFYGALDVAAEYCGLASVPPFPPGMWQHGAGPDWTMVHPNVVANNAPPPMRCFVARDDEVTYLREAGYADVHAIGMPIVYAPPTAGVTRIPNSVLIMPGHLTAESREEPDTQHYLKHVASLQDKFSVVAACVSRPCIERGLWAPDFEAMGIPVITGAGLADANSLRRMRALFESFEVITTNTPGSHIYYALCFGARLSLWGHEYQPSRAEYLRDSIWRRIPDALDRMLSPETTRVAERTLGQFRVPAWEAKADQALGRYILGWGHRRRPAEIRRLFGWTRARLFRHAARQKIRALLPERSVNWLRRVRDGMRSK